MPTRHSALLVFTIVAGCAHAQGQTTSIPPATSVPTSVPTTTASTSANNVDDILDALDKRGKALSDFTADVSKTDTDIANGDESVISGKMWMQKLPADDARLRVSFDRRKRNEKPPEKVHQEYVLAAGTLTDRNY